MGVTTPGVTTPGVTTPGVTTPGVTTPGVTTPGVTTPHPTVNPMVHCEDRARIIQIDSSTNHSSVLMSIFQAISVMSFSERGSILLVYNKLQQILYDTSKTSAQKIAAIFIQLDTYHPTVGSYRTDFFAITIYESDMTTVWGTVGDFWSCGSNCTCALG